MGIRRIESNADFKPQTNGDMIRGMSDEELAEHICCPHDICIDLEKPCNECVLGWLKQEVDNGT